MLFIGIVVVLFFEMIIPLIALPWRIAAYLRSERCAAAQSRTLCQQILNHRVVVVALMIVCPVAALLLCLSTLAMMLVTASVNFKILYLVFLLLVLGRSIPKRGVTGTFWWMRWVWGATAAVWVVLLTQRDAFQPPSQTFSGDTDELRETVVVPTLDTPIPAGKSAVWCASFELAWNRVKTDVVKEPIQIEGAESICDRLNASSIKEKDLDKQSFYVCAGFIRDGVSERIAAELKSRFPQASLPPVNGTADDLVAFSHLELNLPFPVPYADTQMEFLSTNGTSTAVQAFGFKNGGSADMRRQACVLFCTHRENYSVLDEFAVDLCRESKPYQIVVAAIRPQTTLAAALARFDELSAHSGRDGYPSPLHINDELLVPCHHWDVTHRFKELEGVLLNRNFEGYRVATALESVKFRLDRSGASLSSEGALLMVKASPCSFTFNRPHLICIRKRGCNKPVFMMWVANAELLDNVGIKVMCSEEPKK